MTNEEHIEQLKKLRSFYNGSYGRSINKAIDALEQEPKTGHWIKDNPFVKPYCSECKTSCIGLHGFDYTLTNFCPNCGADMREGEV